MSGRLPIKLRLTIAFALAMLALLLAGAALVYLSVRDGLDETVDEALEGRLSELAGIAAATPDPALPRQSLDPEERFAQIVTSEGAVVASSGAPEEAVVAGTTLAEAIEGPIEFEGQVPGIEGTARVVARPGADGTVIVAGQTLAERDETLNGLLAAMLIGGLVAIAAASALGYALAAAALRPMERMRGRAESLSLDDDDLLPLPAAEDELQRLGTTLNRMVTRMRSTHARERQFVADASHELRTPIAVIKAELEASSRIAGDDPELAESLAAALEECDRLAQLAEDLLLLARIGESGLALRYESVDVATLLERTRIRFADRARTAGREIELRLDGPARAYADGPRLAQAVSNLLDNALRYGRGRIVLGSRTAGQELELFVRDEGAGPPAELRGREFERFSRGEDARGQSGAGLGLAIVAAVAEAHGGSAAVSPEAPAEILIRIPAAAPGS